MVKKYVCIPRIFLVISVCNLGKTLSSPCTLLCRNLCFDGGTSKQVIKTHIEITGPNRTPICIYITLFADR